MFQSLIGRIKTYQMYEYTQTEDLFQSLIGRIKTRMVRQAKRDSYKGFQSLIGRIKTLKRGL